MVLMDSYKKNKFFYFILKNFLGWKKLEFEAVNYRHSKKWKKNSLKLFFRMSEKIWEDYSIREVTPFPYLFSPVTNCHSLLQEFFTPSSFIFFSLPFWIAHISPLELVLFQPPHNYISPSAVNTLCIYVTDA